VQQSTVAVRRQYVGNSTDGQIVAFNASQIPRTGDRERKNWPSARQPQARMVSIVVERAATVALRLRPSQILNR
jgi:hypothetical protein